MTEIKITDLVPGGILETDRWHHVTNDGTCSRCLKTIADDDVPLMVWSDDGADLLLYCESCCGIESDLEPLDDEEERR